jgi:hypothetical protein
MIQQKLKTQLNEFKKHGEKFQLELGKGLTVAKTESQRILKELGVNPSVKEFLRNLSVATYDTRFRVNWNANMISAYAKQQAEKAYVSEVKPKISEVRGVITHQLHELQEKTKDLRSRISA